MIYWMMLALIVEANLICWCHFGTPQRKENKQIFYPHIVLTGLVGRVLSVNSDGTYNIEIILDDGSDLLVNVYDSKHRNLIYNIGDPVTIIGYSDGMYLV